MNLLLDTHTFIWHADASPRMSAAATALLADPNNSLFVSVVSIWEIAIKSGLKKLTLGNGYAAFVTTAINTYRLAVLPVTFEDCVEYEALPFPLANHRDPFDRMLIAQARRNNLSVVGTDTNFDAYGITRLW
ncbi:MAG TPA: type II toxin-antitoxin system VapC family toxin [Urbifossiella sp.]|nr:type II toxin-antitoxin system VapC family toxin [Urbifossiella sp.]